MTKLEALLIGFVILHLSDYMFAHSGKEIYRIVLDMIGIGFFLYVIFGGQ